MMSKHLRIRVEGKVQGVFFRASALGLAERLGLKGFVRNERDGSVLIEIEGPENALQDFVAWAREGPPAARVTSVTVEEGPPKGFADFRIEYV